MDIHQEKLIGCATIAAESSGHRMNDKENIETWVKWMEWGHRLGCHQKEERSFFIKGYQFPVCARCSGVFLGYLAALILLPITLGREKIVKLLALLGGAIMLLDWSLQAFKIKESTNMRRLASGIVGGFGIMTIWIYFIKAIILKLKK
ncbi:MAG: DUF2085 domain-containing protein [Velocimicrobium sp.]